MPQFQISMAALLLVTILIVSGCAQKPGNSTSAAKSTITAVSAKSKGTAESDNGNLSCTVNDKRWACSSSGGLVLKNPHTKVEKLMLTFEAGNEALSLTFDLSTEQLVSASLTTNLKDKAGKNKNCTLVYFNKSKSKNKGTGSGELSQDSANKASGNFVLKMHLAQFDSVELDDSVAREYEVSGTFADVSFENMHRRSN